MIDLTKQRVHLGLVQSVVLMGGTDSDLFLKRLELIRKF